MLDTQPRPRDSETSSETTDESESETAEEVPDEYVNESCVPIIKPRTNPFNRIPLNRTPSSDRFKRVKLNRNLVFLHWTTFLRDIDVKKLIQSLYNRGRWTCDETIDVKKFGSELGKLIYMYRAKSAAGTWTRKDLTCIDW